MCIIVGVFICMLWKFLHLENVLKDFIELTILSNYYCCLLPFSFNSKHSNFYLSFSYRNDNKLNYPLHLFYSDFKLTNNSTNNSRRFTFRASFENNLIVSWQNQGVSDWPFGQEIIQMHFMSSYVAFIFDTLLVS